ncbi:UNVERIFIED_CONTAM: hypothetical protein Slati_2463100 [Sesamum latifolium]|uniref:Endonuclease/exonuclease/phosphatase domain-containing protein n=1 Tax=Sesamum latifolium TaxID=2727402 RepID=A0AAW2WG79_9LAMI
MLNAAIWNVRGLNQRDHQVAVKDLISSSGLHFVGLLETRVTLPNASRVQLQLLPRWKWFIDYNVSGNRIWLAWDDNFVDIEVIDIGAQFIHCWDLWLALNRITQGINEEPCLVGGDFNAVLDISEVCGASGDIRLAMEEFQDCILQTGLIGLPLRGERFTWHNCSMDGCSLWKRLDRMLVNDSWLGRWPTALYESLTPRTSDHSPLLLRGSHKLDRQQRRAKGDLTANVKLAADFLEISQQLLQLDRHNELLLHLEHCCRLVYLKATKLEQVTSRRAAKRIFQISDATGETFTDPEGARHIISTDEAQTLIRPFTREEVKAALFDIEEDRAPGPDGYSSGFSKAAWPIVGDEVTRAVLNFFATGRLLKQVNATLLTLIPKVSAPNLVVDFRPISCCNVIYKIISKLLVLRLRVILGKLVSPSQNAFVPDRSIGDNILLAQELFRATIN